MRILLVHQHFLTPSHSGSTRTYHLAEGLTKAGHQVVILSGRSPKDPTSFKVVTVKVKYGNYMNVAQRITAFAVFVLKANVKVLTLGKFDVCIASSTPLTVGLVAKWLKFWKNVPYIFEVRDLWPDFPIEMGAVKHKFLVKWLYRFERSIYASANAVVVLSPDMETNLRLKNIIKPIYLVSNFSETDIFYRQEVENTLLKPDELGVVHFGAAGKANALNYFIDIAQASQEMCNKLKFFIVGDGSEIETLRQQSASKRLSNISFINPIPKKDMPKFLSQMHFSYVSFAQVRVLKSNSPNKLFDSLAMALVLVVNTNGWMKKLVEENDLGFYANPDEPRLCVEKMLHYMRHPELMKSTAQRAKKMATEHFSAQVAIDKYLKILESFN